MNGLEILVGGLVVTILILAIALAKQVRRNEQSRKE